MMILTVRWIRCVCSCFWLIELAVTVLYFTKLNFEKKFTAIKVEIQMIIFLTIINKFLVFHSLVLAFVTKIRSPSFRKTSMYLFLANYWSLKTTVLSHKYVEENGPRILLVPLYSVKTQSRLRSTNQSSTIFHEKNYAKRLVNRPNTLHLSYESCFEIRHEWKYETTTDSERFPFGWRMLGARSRVARKHLAAFY